MTTMVSNASHIEGRSKGNLIIKDGYIGIGTVSPKKARVRLSSGGVVRFEGAMVKKSRKGKAAMFGVLALAARNQQNATYVSIPLTGGTAVTYEVKGIAAPRLAAKFRPELAKYGVVVQ
jgi:hypothetical protein